MSYKATNWAYDMKITGPAKPVLVALADMADEDATCYPGQDRIAEMTGLSVATVRRALGRLESFGLLVREHRYGNFGYRTSDRYRLQLSVTMPESLPLTVPTRQRAFKALSQSLPLTVQLPTAHSARAVEPSVKPLENHQGGNAPQERCQKHLLVDNPPRCGACADSRKAHARWVEANAPKPAETVSGIVTPPACKTHGMPDCSYCREAVAS